jgi:hypothetical protein
MCHLINRCHGQQRVTAHLAIDPAVLLLACRLLLPAVQPPGGEGLTRHGQAPYAGLVEAYPPQPCGDGFTAGGCHWSPAFLDLEGCG